MIVVISTSTARRKLPGTGERNKIQDKRNKKKQRNEGTRERKEQSGGSGEVGKLWVRFS